MEGEEGGREVGKQEGEKESEVKNSRKKGRIYYIDTHLFLLLCHRCHIQHGTVDKLNIY